MDKHEKIITDIFGSNIVWMDLQNKMEIDQYIVSKYFSQISSYWLPLLLPYETSKPEMFYSEDSYVTTLEILQKSFEDNFDYFEKCVLYFANEIDSAYAGLQRITKAVEALPNTEIDREPRLRQYYFPVYQELIEGIWKALARFCVIALEKPAEAELQTYAKYKINVLEDKLRNKHLKFDLLSGFDRILRNNIAHHKIEFSDDVMKHNTIVLHDPEPIDMPDYEIRDLLLSLYDNCTAIIYCILKFGAVNEDKLKSIPFGHYVRSQIVSLVLKNKRIFIEENTFVVNKEIQQRNLKIQYNYPCDIRAVMFVLFVLKLVVLFLTSKNYFITVAPPKGMPYIWVTTTHDRAVMFTEDNLGLSEYLKSGDIQIFRDQKKIFRTPIIPVKLTLIPQLLFLVASNIKKNFLYHKGWSVLYEYNFSTGISGRFEIFLTTYKDLSPEKLKAIIVKIIRKKRGLFKHLLLALWHLIYYAFNKKTRPAPPVNVVLVSVWNKEKRQSQLYLNPHSKNNLCVCYAEWNQDEHFKQLTPQEKDENYNNITIRWFNK